MSENVRSLIRHLLTIVGGLLTVFGLTKYSGVLEYVSNSVEPIYAAVTAVIGFCVSSCLTLCADSNCLGAD